MECMQKLLLCCFCDLTYEVTNIARNPVAENCMVAWLSCYAKFQTQTELPHIHLKMVCQIQHSRPSLYVVLPGGKMHNIWCYSGKLVRRGVMLFAQ